MGLNEIDLRHYKPQIEVTQENLVRGKVPSPFTSAELDLLKNMRDGVDGDEELARSLGIKAETYRSRRADISSKVTDLYAGSGGDNLIKGLSLSILGGWLEEPEYKDKKIELDKIEYALLFQRCFGRTSREVIAELHITPNWYNQIFIGIKDKLNLKSDNQVIAWGACQAKKYLLENLSK